MASLQARHQRSCALYPWSTFANATKAKGCTCGPPGPLYHVVNRHEKKLVREAVGHNRKLAERSLDAHKGAVAERRYRGVPKEITFEAWADRWLEGFTGKANSRRVYKTTIDRAKPVFGKTKIRDLDVSDVRRFLDAIHKARAPRKVSPATAAKHLRQLSACIEAAIAEDYAEVNPVRKLHRTARPRVEPSKPSYYTDAELARLWPELENRPVYLTLCKLAVATGMRFGELVALTWDDVDLLAREVHVTKALTAGEARVIDLTPQAATLLESWLTESGDDGLVFEREDGGHLRGDYARRWVLYPALERAGIDRVGERGGERDFHSFRHTFARLALEGGASIDWVRRQLGHSSITLTVDTYGSWARSAEKAEAEKLGAFPI